MKAFIHRWLLAIAMLLIFITIGEPDFFPRLFSSEPAKVPKYLFPIILGGVTFGIALFLSIVSYFSKRRKDTTTA